MSISSHRELISARMADSSILILYSGIALHVSEDEYMPFHANRQFLYLTDIDRENMILVMRKRGEKVSETLYIPEVNPSSVRWTGRMMTPEEAAAVSGIADIRYLPRFVSETASFVQSEAVETAYFDTHLHSAGDLPDYNLVKAREFSSRYPAVEIRSVRKLAGYARRAKDEEEIRRHREAIDITRKGLEHVMSVLKPGMKEYQAQAEFEYVIRWHGADSTAFPTIAGAGPNGCMLHYVTNRDECRGGDLLLLDLGARKDGYNADITRTYPISGRYTERQRRYYDIVLKANREIAHMAKPGTTTKELNDICRGVLAQGLMEMGKISSPEEVSRYYMHGVSHQIGLDVHDIDIFEGKELRPGYIISDEPGLYIDEEGIGIRIEDDLLITEDGCECLSEDIIRDPDLIEAFMKEHNPNVG